MEWNRRCKFMILAKVLIMDKEREGWQEERRKARSKKGLKYPWATKGQRMMIPQIAS